MLRKFIPVAMPAMTLAVAILATDNSASTAFARGGRGGGGNRSLMQNRGSRGFARHDFEREGSNRIDSGARTAGWGRQAQRVFDRAQGVDQRYSALIAGGGRGPRGPWGLWGSWGLPGTRGNWGTWERVLAAIQADHGRGRPPGGWSGVRPWGSSQRLGQAAPRVRLGLGPQRLGS